MALSDKEILAQKETGNIVIEPFHRSNLNTSSYDVLLGEWFFPEQRQESRIFNIWSENNTRKVWGCEPKRATLAEEVLPSIPLEDREGIAPNDRVILIGPGETILGHTEEFIGGRNCITTSMQARSSMGRNFIEVCKCAGWGDVGFINRWTMEITNNSRFYTIPLVVGRRIAQIVFIHTGPILGDDYAKFGKYQEGDTLQRIKQTWIPQMMLPRLYKDREILEQRQIALAI